jgi:hypothetical protein
VRRSVDPALNQTGRSPGWVAGGRCATRCGASRRRRDQNALAEPGRVGCAPIERRGLDTAGERAAHRLRADAERLGHQFALPLGDPAPLDPVPGRFGDVVEEDPLGPPVPLDERKQQVHAGVRVVGRADQFGRSQLAGPLIDVLEQVPVDRLQMGQVEGPRDVRLAGRDLGGPDCRECPLTLLEEVGVVDSKRLIRQSSI